jgi:hypothetical protein
MLERVRTWIADNLFGAHLVEERIRKAITADPPSQGPRATVLDVLSLIQNRDFTEPHTGGTGYLAATDLRRMAKIPVVAAILGTRINQIASYCSPQEDPDEPGFVLKPKTKDAEQDRKAHDRLEAWLRNAGLDGYGVGLERLVRQTMRDSLTLDALAVEIVPNRLGFPAYLVPVDAATIRRTTASAQTIAPTDDQFVQVINDQPVARFSSQQLIYAARNIPTDVTAAHYGESELTSLVRTITTLANNESFNAGKLSQGGTSKGVLVVQSETADKTQFDAFKRDFREAIRNASSYWRPPVLQTGKDAKVEWVELDRSERDQEFGKLYDHLVRLACAVYYIAPEEIGWTAQSSSGTTFESRIEGRLYASYKKGLKPLLTFLADTLNRNVIRRLDDRFELRFVGGLSSRRETSEIIDKEVRTYRTVAEVRAERGLPYLRGTNIILWGSSAPDSYVTVEEDAKRLDELE